MSTRLRTSVALIGLLSAIGCRGDGSRTGERALTADLPLHLEDHVDAARVEGSEIPKNIPAVASWTFNKDQAAWKAAVPLFPQTGPPQFTPLDDAWRMTLPKETLHPYGFREGAVYVDLPDWDREDWGLVVVRARTSDDIRFLQLAFNLRDRPGKTPAEQSRFLYSGDYVPIIKDGEVHTYLLRLENVRPEGWTGPWRHLGTRFGPAGEKADTSGRALSLDILSVSVIPQLMNYAQSKAGASIEDWEGTTRRALYSHAPGKLTYRVVVPKNGRLDVGLGVLKKTLPVKFRITLGEGRESAEDRILLEETCSSEAPRIQRCVDLSPWAGRTVNLALETEAGRPGNVAFWGSPTLSGERRTDKPNVVLYIIDGAAADFMSVYGYNRRTTPHLERLAAEGVVFERAYSNSSWTKPSVPSFMTSLHSSVLGGFQNQTDPLPEQAVTMAERMHKAGYLTEVLASNPYCGRATSLDRGVDRLADTAPDYGLEEFIPSAALHREFWKMRDAYPGEPYWVHVQPTDVHFPWKPAAPFAGLFATPDERRTFDEMRKKMRGLIAPSYEEIVDKSGIDQALYFHLARKLYDESMAHQDHMIGQLVGRLKERGEWERTLFIVASDHGHRAASLPLLDPKRPKYDGPLLAAFQSHIPMIFVWPGRIAGGRRFSQPVSMVDMLPTILELAGLPPPAVAQGQSLAPLLLGRAGWTPRPVVLDEFKKEGPYLYGSLEVIDGRWGASLRIDPRPEDRKTPRQLARPAPLLVFDLWEDPQAFRSLHRERPDLVEKYGKLLDQLWREHQALAKSYSRAGEVALNPAQIETLRSLGYIR